MRRDIRMAFNEEVERYRRALIFAAKACEWTTFKTRAGRLFDYIESVEVSEIERKFFRVFLSILCVVIFIAIIMNADSLPSPYLSKYREKLTLIALSIACYEFYFLYSFQLFMKAKMACYRKRREDFIRNIENDFRDMVHQLGN